MGGTTGDLRVPTQAVSVELARAGQPPERVEVFVVETPLRGRTSLAEAVAALLEQEPAFLPVREPDAAGGPRVALVRKRAVVWVAIPLGPAIAGVGPASAGDGVPAEVEPDSEPSEIISLFDHRHDVRVELDVGGDLAGHVLYSSPADRPRLVDHLNLPVRFVRVWTPDALYLVNKDHVVRVLELD